LVPHPAAGLHGYRDTSRDGGDDVTVHGHTGARRVQVHDVDPRGTGGLEGAGLGDGVVAVDGLSGVVALVQTDAASVAQIDGRVQVHRGPDAQRSPTTASRRAARPR